MFFLLSGFVVKVSKRVEQNNNREHAEEKKQNFSLSLSLSSFLLFSAFLSFLCFFLTKTFPFLLLVFILSARTSSLSFVYRGAHTSSRARHPLCSCACSFNTKECFERRERETQSARCLWWLLRSSLIGKKSTGD